MNPPRHDLPGPALPVFFYLNTGQCEQFFQKKLLPSKVIRPLSAGADIQESKIALPQIFFNNLNH